jgi:hypothetical protein
LHDKECTATTRPAKPPLPCVERKSHGKGFAERRCFAVRCEFLCRAHSFAVRLQALPCGRLCRAPPHEAARQRQGFAVRFPSTPHGKDSTGGQLGGAVHSWASFAVRMCTAKTAFAVRFCLCRVHVHGKGAEKFQRFAVSV